ncbi:MAG: tRNA (adenosine(37)-N6)-threonylcarbamoyltransferase complex transferase subunit TsaD [Flavobacteriales bacterium]|nr:tRNA (adenosine(37)-N6)-threonylcarbamoyltransferase complex transferase subunit TsaD [Flavobacteriales bacterium]
MRQPPEIILGIESSCDETAAAVMVDGVLRSNVVAGQDVHRHWGGVVPELAGRAHQEHIVPVVHQAMRQAGVERTALTAIAVTRGPGLMGALLVGACFARSMAQALRIPLLAVDHVQAHVLAHFIDDGEPRPRPQHPFLNLTVSGGHTQLVLVHGPLRMETIGTTLDDAAGEAFDKGAKMLGLPYPGGPMVERHAQGGDPRRHPLPRPRVPGLDMSFSGVKAAFRQTLEKGTAQDPAFIGKELPHLCAALQHTIVRVLLARLRDAASQHGVQHIALAGGVSANKHLRAEAAELARREGWQLFLPPFAYCTDNAAMIAMAGRYLLHAGHVAPLDMVPQPRI